MLNKSIQEFQSYLATKSACAPNILFEDFKIGAKAYLAQLKLQNHKIIVHEGLD